MSEKHDQEYMDRIGEERMRHEQVWQLDAARRTAYLSKVMPPIKVMKGVHTITSKQVMIEDAKKEYEERQASQPIHQVEFEK